MLELKLISVDGLDGIWGLHLVWYNGVNYRLTPCEFKEAEDVRKLYPHWVVYLSGDPKEDTQEIKRQTFLTDKEYKKCIHDIGLDPVDAANLDDITIYLRITDDAQPVEQLVKKGHAQKIDKNVICAYAATDTNEAKVSEIIAGALKHGYDLESALVFVIQLGYKAQDRIAEELREIVETVDALTV